MQNLPTSFTIEQLSGCGSLLFTDTSQYGNGGGSGENPSFAEVTGTSIVFELSNGVTITINSFLPEQGATDLEVFSFDLGYGTEPIPDQIATITYTVYGASGEVLGQSVQPTLFCCNFLACFYSNAQSVVANNCCDRKKLCALMELWVEFLGLQASIGCNSCCSQGDIEQLNAACAKFCLTGNCG